MPLIGIDIGGTKTGVVLADPAGSILHAEHFATAGPEATIARIVAVMDSFAAGPEPDIGIACGGPLDAAAGLICSPPNLPGWDRIPICAELVGRCGGRAWLMNDANAGALAEWTWGAGQGLRHLVFLTCGTGLGGGVICDGRLLDGANGNAGELGHVRLSPDGPVGYGKAGSVEGWCSGGGLARRLLRERQAGLLPLGWTVADARELVAAAGTGDTTARALLADTGRHLGQALAILVDLFNPQAIILGSLYVRARALLEGPLHEELAREALPEALAVCRVLPAALGDELGDRQALAVARYHLNGGGSP